MLTDSPMIPWLLSAALGGAVSLVVWALFRHPAPIEPPIHRRFALAVGATRQDTLLEQPLLAPATRLALSAARRLNLPGVRQRIRQDLEASGNPHDASVDETLAMAILSGAGLGVMSAIVSLVLAGVAQPMVVITLAALGFAGPLWTLRSAARARVMRISKQLPYTLDLIALMMAAGATFTEAVDTLVRDNPQDDLNQELQLVQAEINLGAKRAVALANLAQRVGLESLRSVVGAVNQAETLGTPLAAILKSQSDMMRMHRHVRAEKLSASASLQILFPSMLILVAVVLVVFGPWIIRAYRGELM